MRPSQPGNEESAGGGRGDGRPTADDLQAQIGRLRPGGRRPAEEEKKPEDEGVDAFNAELLQKLRQRRGDVAGEDSDEEDDPDDSEWGARKSSLLDGARKYLVTFFSGGSRKQEDPDDPDDSDEAEYEYEDPDAEDPDQDDDDLGDFDYNIYEGPALGL